MAIRKSARTEQVDFKAREEERYVPLFFYFVSKSILYPLVLQIY